MSHIRKREPKDLAKILEIWYQASLLAHSFLDEEILRQEKSDIEKLYLPASVTWVYEENQEVLGFISMLGNEIGGLFISPKHHSKGIGTQLVDFVQKIHGDLEVEVFENNIIGRTFYGKYGFVPIERYFHEKTQNFMLKCIFKP